MEVPIIRKIQNIVFPKNLKKAAISDCEITNCEFDGVELCFLENTIFKECRFKGKWFGNTHAQSEIRDIFINCDHKEEHESSGFTNVKDFHKIKGVEGGKLNSNDMGETD